MLRFCVRMLFWLAVAMTSFGLLVLSYAGKSQAPGAAHFFQQQAAFLVISAILAFGISHINYRIFKKPAVYWTLAALMFIALLCVLIPGIGKEVKGSHRWIGIGPINLQPIEFVKIFGIVFIAGYLEAQGGLVNRWVRGFLVPLGVIGILLTLLILQPDFGGSLVFCLLAGMSLLIGGVSILKCIPAGAAAIVLIGIFILCNPNRVERLSKDKDGENHQAKQAEIALQNGGAFGVGLAQGMQKERYLPECHTDFIYAIIGEDLGFAATSSIMVGFLLFMGCGVVIAFRAKDKQGVVIAYGATFMICVQAAANMAVVTHIFPTKGLALPFFSYGGSCLLATYTAVGLVWAVGRRTLREQDKAPPTVKISSI